MTMTMTMNESQLDVWEPDATDRCDRCGTSSRAYARAVKGKLMFMLCAHHTNTHMSELIAQGWDVDNRVDILEAQVKAYKAVSPDSTF